MKRLLSVVMFLVLMTGCGTNSSFVYKPSSTAEAGRKLPVKLAVLPFADGTEDFTKRGSVLAPATLSYNLVKGGISGQITALTPEFWAKSFADETAASGDFRAVRFLYDPRELSDEDYLVEGTVEKATFAGSYQGPNDFVLALKATRRADNRTVWGKTVSHTWETPQKILYAGCGEFGFQCIVDRHKEDILRAMREIFVTARADLVAALSPLSGTGPDDLPTELQPGSVDATIEAILKAR